MKTQEEIKKLWNAINNIQEQLDIQIKFNENLITILRDDSNLIGFTSKDIEEAIKNKIKNDNR